MISFYHFHHPFIGWLKLYGTVEGLSGLNFMNAAPEHLAHPEELKPWAGQLQEYFDRERKTFDIPLILNGTEFQQNIWYRLQEIPYGHTATYLQLALELGDRKATRAVGSAVGANPIPIIIPCHRVIGTDRSLTGYSGGLENKEKLLMLENPKQFGRQEELF